MVIVRRVKANSDINLGYKITLDSRKYVGFWAKDKDDDKFIHPSSLISEPYDDKDVIVKYLQDGNKCAHYFGWANCRLCGCENGFSDMTDGVWLWPEGLYHYVDSHNVKLPKEFISHIRLNDTVDSAGKFEFGAPNYDFWDEWCKAEASK